MSYALEIFKISNPQFRLKRIRKWDTEDLSPLASAPEFQKLNPEYQRSVKEILELWKSPFVLSQCLFGSVVGFAIVFVFFTLLLQDEYYQLTDGMVFTCIILFTPSEPAFTMTAVKFNSFANE